MDCPTLETPPGQATTSACAKFLLAGEYSVLNGGPALAVPLSHLRLGYSESKTKPHEPVVLLNGAPIKSPDALEKFWRLRKLMSVDSPSTQICITTKIPIGKGLGSSAALCVAMAKHFKPQSSITEIAELALKGEQLFHGNPSGVDPYCVSLETPMAYYRSPRHHELLNMRSLRESGMIFFLRDSGGEHSTKDLIQALMSKPLIIESLQSDAEQMKIAVELSADKIPVLMKSIQNKLQELGASNKAIETNISELYAWGALGAKITGSGRGGFVLSIFDPKTFAKLPLSAQQQGISWVPT